VHEVSPIRDDRRFKDSFDSLILINFHIPLWNARQRILGLVAPSEKCELGRAKKLCTIAQPFSRNFDTMAKGGFMVETDKSEELSEAVWQAWLKKNKAQDKFRFERRLKVMGFVVGLGLVIGLLWKLIG